MTAKALATDKKTGKFRIYSNVNYIGPDGHVQISPNSDKVTVNLDKPIAVWLSVDGERSWGKVDKLNPEKRNMSKVDNCIKLLQLSIKHLSEQDLKALENSNAKKFYDGGMIFEKPYSIKRAREIMISAGVSHTFLAIFEYAFEIEKAEVLRFTKSGQKNTLFPLY